MRKGLLKAITALALSAAIIFPSGDTGLTVSAAAEQQVCTEHVHFEAEHYAASTVEPPKANKTSGSTIECDGDSTSIILSADTGAVIYYRVGSSGSYKKYTSPIKLTKNSTIYTYAEKGGKKSSTVTYNYYLIPKLNISVSGSGKSKTVKVTTKTSGVKLSYSLSSDSASKSTQYPSSGITVKKDCTVKIEAVKKDWKSETKSRSIIMDMSKYGKTDKLGSGKFSMPVAPEVACMRYNNGEEFDAEADCFYSSNSNSKFDTVGIFPSQGTVFIRLEANDTIVKGTTYDLAKSNSQMKSNVSISDFSAIDGGKEHQTGTDKVIEKAEIQFSTLDFTGKNASVMYFYILARDPKTGNKISLEGRSKFYITDSPHGKTTGSSSSTGTSSSSSDTKQLGASSFTTPSTGKATMRYNGSTKTYSASQTAGRNDTCNVDTDSFKVDISSNQYVSFIIAAGAKFNTGDTLTLSDMNGLDKGSGQVVLKGLDLQSSSYTFSHNAANLFDKIELKAVDMDYTGAKPSTIYFYILAHDESGKKISLEGLAKVNIKDSKRGMSSSSSSGSSGTDTNSRPKPMDVSEFTDLKIPAEAGKVYTDENKECGAKYKFEGALASSADTYTVYFDKVSYTDAMGRSKTCYPKICIGIDTTVKFETGDTLYLSDFTGEKSASNIIFSNFYHWNGLNSAQRNRDHCTSIGSDRFKKVVVKAVDMDYTGENPSVIYYNIQLDSWTFEGIIKVKIDSTKRNAPYDPTCPICGGDGKVLCHLCGGTGRYYNAFSREFEKCSKCKGDKKLKCDYCNGKGVV